MIIKLMNHQLNFLYPAFYSAVSGFVFYFPIVIFYPSLINADKYDNIDVQLLLLAGFFDAIGLCFKCNALTYEKIS